MQVRVNVGIQAAKAAELFEQAAHEARANVGDDGAFEIEIPLEPNGAADPQIVKLVFSNDDMEREELNGRVLADWFED